MMRRYRILPQVFCQLVRDALRVSTGVNENQCSLMRIDQTA